MTRILFAFAIICLLCPSLARATDDLRTVVLTGDHVLDQGALFTSLSTPSLNDLGQVAFKGYWGDNFSEEAVFSEGSGSLRLLARSNQHAGFEPGVTIDNFTTSQPVINNFGQTAFGAFLMGSGIDTSNNGVIYFADTNGDLTAIVRESQPLPSGAGVVVGGASDTPLLNDRGDLVMRLNFATDAGQFSGYYQLPTGAAALEPIAIYGDPAPKPEPTTDTIVIVHTASLNNHGEIAFESLLGHLSGGVSNDEAIIRSRPGEPLDLVAYETGPAPGLGEGVEFVGVSFPSMNEHGKVAFFGVVDQLNGQRGQYQVLFSEGGGDGLQPVMRVFDPAPGLPAGLYVQTFLDQVTINDAGQTVFLATLNGEGSDSTNRSALYRHTPGEGIELVARTGEPAPGMGEDRRLRSLGFPITINDRGQIALRALLTPTDEFAFPDALYVEDVAGNLRLIAYEGGQLDVSDDPSLVDLRTVSTLDFLAGRRGSPAGLNDVGQIAFRASFTDGTSGIFVSDTARVPEPAAWILLGMLALIPQPRRR